MYRYIDFWNGCGDARSVRLTTSSNFDSASSVTNSEHDGDHTVEYVEWASCNGAKAGNGDQECWLEFRDRERVANLDAKDDPIPT